MKEHFSLFRLLCGRVLAKRGKLLGCKADVFLSASPNPKHTLSEENGPAKTTDPKP